VTTGNDHGATKAFALARAAFNQCNETVNLPVSAYTGKVGHPELPLTEREGSGRQNRAQQTIG
jgi:hypothetical protein